MSEAIEPSLFRRMRHTPLRDALRGRITGRLDIAFRLETSGLPVPAQELIRRVARRTRLWRLERAEVVDELIAHFADGIEAGESAERLVASFGDERAAARLIARAKRRNRGIVWQTLVALRWLACGLIAFYLLSGIYFYSGRPSINVNYVERLNAPLKDVPAGELAWPLYREAIPQLRITKEENGSQEVGWLLDAEPGTPRWKDTVAWLQSHEQPIELARQATQKPTLGFVLGPDGSARDPQLFPHIVDPSPDEQQPLVMNVLLPHLNDLRHIAVVLHADARLAREQGDMARLMRDIAALCKLADHLRDGEFLIDDLVAIGVRDLIQRLYTDDGNGDGRLTPDGARLLKSFTVSAGRPSDPLLVAATPLLPVITASRRELVEATEQLMDLADASLARPIREADWAAYDERIRRWRESPVGRVKFAPLLRDWSGYGALVPALGGAQATAERLLGRRDGLIVALALELHRQRHGAYPEALDALAPALLPQVPADRITGGPVRYRIVDGHPLVYSVGADRDDDGGRPPLNKSGEPDPSRAARWNVALEKAADGDWVLYSQSKSEEVLQDK